MNVATVVSKSELEELKGFLDAYIESTGESVTEIANRAGVNRRIMSEFRNGSTKGSPQLENYIRTLKAIGKKTIVVDDNFDL